MRDLFFSSRLTKGWESWAVRKAFGVLIVAVLVGAAMSFVIDLFAVAAIGIGIFCWFRYRQYASVNALIIAVGCALAFIGVFVTINGSSLGLATTAVGFYVVVRFFSEGPMYVGPVKKVTKKRKRKKKPPSSQ